MIEADIALKKGVFELNVGFALDASGITVVTGPSGAGKTTLLRSIAGLEKQTRGTLVVSGEAWQDGKIGLPAHKRLLGYVFQDARLFPHLNVEDNLRYGLRRASSNTRHLNMTDVIEWLRLSNLLARRPYELSGGEKQRVALGRALLSQPQILLMDEPLVSLDRESHQQLLDAIKTIVRKTNIVTLYVCHTEDEIVGIAGNILYLERGKVLYHGSTENALLSSLLPYIHRENPRMLLAGNIKTADPENIMTHIDTVAGLIHVPGVLQPGKGNIHLAFHANDLSIALQRPVSSSIANTMEAVIQAIEVPANPALNGVLNIFLDAQGQKLLSRITRKSANDLALREGVQVFLQLKSVAAQVIF